MTKDKFITIAARNAKYNRELEGTILTKSILIGKESEQFLLTTLFEIDTGDDSA